jgi:hypothetical protein
MTKKLIFGSVAIKHFYPDFREPKDIDYIWPEPLSTRIEEHIWIPEFEELVAANKDDTYLDPELILTVKCSHFGYNNQWEKHRNDILFLRKKGLTINKPLYKTLFKGWRREFGDKWAQLKDKSPDQFFDDAVERKYVHDYIHEAVATYDAPLYYRILERPDSVKCLESKFLLLSEEDQLTLCKEEVWVTALERYLIPSNFTFSPQLAYNNSLKKLVTTMSGAGWFKHFLVDNYHKLFYDKDKSYIARFKQAEQEGKIRLIK